MSVFSAVNVGSFPINTRDHVRFFIGGLIALIDNSSSCDITFHVIGYDHHRLSTTTYTLYQEEPEIYSLNDICGHVDIDEIVEWLYNHLDM